MEGDGDSESGPAGPIDRIARLYLLEPGSRQPVQNEKPWSTPSDPKVAPRHPAEPTQITIVGIHSSRETCRDSFTPEWSNVRVMPAIGTG